MKTALACLLGIAIGAGAMLPWALSMRSENYALADGYREIEMDLGRVKAEKEQMLNTMAGMDAALGSRQAPPLTAEEITALKKKYPLPSQVAR